MHARQGLRIGIAVVVVSLGAYVFGMPRAHAWDFTTSTCTSSKTESFSTRQPQTHLLLDQSGSMGGSKWTTAVSSINNAVSDMTTSDPDTAEFGLQTWSDSPTTHVLPKENAATDISNALSSESPGGDTYMSSAMNQAETDLGNAGASSRIQASILITDGEPEDDQEANDAIWAACQHQQNKGPVYVVGFESGADVDYNNALAAAGGTGVCCDSSVSQSNCSKSHSKYFDICSISDTKLENNDDGRNFTCKGAYQASSGTALKSAINDVAGTLSCMVDVSAWGGKWKDSHYDCAPHYDCFKVYLPGSSERIYHMNSGNTPNGWKWLDPNQKDRIQLTNGYCTKVKGLTDDSVEVTRACMCNNGAGSCSYSGANTCECTVGDWACNQGVDSCAQRSQSSCASSNLKGTGASCELGKGVCKDKGSTFCNSSWALKCSASPKTGNKTTETCGDGKDNDCDGATDESATGSCTVSGKKGRCSVGTKGCSSGTVVCNQDFAPMPEICNGLDDDCNGVVDDIKTSWSSTSWGFSLTKSQEDRACGKIHQCVCKSGDADTKHRGNKSAATDEDEFDSMTSNTMTSCYCSE